MSYAPDYTPTNSFADDESNQAAGRSTVKTDELDAQFADISATANALNNNLKLLQRDDGKLRDLLVEPYALSEQTRAMMAALGRTPRGEWATFTDYAVGDLVQRNAVAYMCQTAHNSGPTFNVGFWLAISGDGSAAYSAEQAIAAAAAAALSQAAAIAAAAAAALSASGASGSAGAAAASALAAQNAADSIAGLAPVNLSAYMLTFLANNNATGARSTLGVISAAVLAGTTGAEQIGHGLLTVAQALDNLASVTSTRVVPSGFDWAGILPTVCGSVGRAQFTEGVNQYMRRANVGITGGGVCYVDPAVGNDANSGGINDPVRTLEYALRQTSATLVLCQGGEYIGGFQFRNTDPLGNRWKRLVALGPCFVRNAADDLSSLTWTPDGTYSNVYWAPLTGANISPAAVLDLASADLVDQPTPLTKCVSTADCNASSYGWYHDDAADRLYVRMGLNNINAVKQRLRLVTGDATTKVLALGVKIHFEGAWHFEGVFWQPAQGAGTRGMISGEFPASSLPTLAYVAGSHGIDLLGGELLVQGAWIHRSMGDNIHYFDDGGVSSRGIEINCRSTYAGDADTYGPPVSGIAAGIRSADGTQNASSMHGTGYVLRINGDYGYSYGPVLPDSGTGKSWNVGVVAHDSQAPGNSYGFATTGSPSPTLLLDYCASFSNLTGDILADAGQIKAFATSFRTSAAINGGSITAYTPNSP